MSKMTRVKKYRDLRESICSDVTLPKQEIEYNKEEKVEIPTVEEYREEQQNKKSVFFDTSEILQDEIDYESIENVEKALSKVRMNSGKDEAYNTRFDILNQINGQQNDISSSHHKDVEVEVNHEEAIQSKNHLEKENLFINHVDSCKHSHEKIEDTCDVAQQEYVHDHFHEDKVAKDHNISVEEEYIDKDYSNSKSNAILKILNVSIIILSICLIALICYMVFLVKSHA